MYDFHLDRYSYFKTQTENTQKSVIPFLASSGFIVKKGMKVLEVGCAEGGVLKAFTDMGCYGIGVELTKLRFNQANDFLADEINEGKVKIYHCDIFDPDLGSLFIGKFDLIILKDVIEHIHGHKEIILLLSKFLRPFGKIFFGFPPWRMPFGGHQQICKSKFLSRMPWIHLLPENLYGGLLRYYKENTAVLMEIRQTRIGITKFEKINEECGLSIAGKKHFLIAPIYEYKFGLKTREQLWLVKKIPYLRDFFTTCVYYIFSKTDSKKL